MNRAVFLDRDGTIVDDPGFLRDPDRVQLLPGAAAALLQLQQMGFVLVVVSNQSGIGRGIFTAEQLEAVNLEVGCKLEAEGVRIAAWYHCPHAPDAGCQCRKPGTLLHRQAARDLDIDLTASWWIGDRISDLLPATELGGRGVLVTTGEGEQHAEAARQHGFSVVAGLAEAVKEVRSKK